MQCEEFTNEDLMELEAQRKDEERQEEEEVTEEPKRFTMQEMVELIGDGGQASISLTPDVNGPGSGSLLDSVLSTLLKK